MKQDVLTILTEKGVPGKGGSLGACGRMLSFLILFVVLFSNAAFGQTKSVTGVVSDTDGNPAVGATVLVENTQNGALVGVDGTFKIDVKDSDVLVVSLLGMETQQVEVAGKTHLIVVLKEKSDVLDEVTVVAFSTQKKESVISSITTVRPAELRVPSSNLTTALGGRIAGIVSYQRSGEPGLDNAEFFIRGVTTFGYKKDPLILIDNVELPANELARLQVDDIASFSIMKDASAASLYGARGANGVILVTTKEGREGKMQFNVRAENSFSMATKKVERVDPVTYMLLHNEAYLTRGNPQRPYSNQKIDGTRSGVNPYYYPAVDWYNELFRNVTTNQRVNLNVSGGGGVARYYVAAALTNDEGSLKVDPKNNYNNNIDLKRIQVRMNTNVNLTKTTELLVKVFGTFEDYNGPIYSGTQVYNMTMAANPVLFPKYYEPTPAFAYAKHSLFGNYDNQGDYLNPYAEMVRGYKDYSQSTIVAQIEVKQNLDFITKGLNFRLMGSTTRDSWFNIIRSYKAFWYRATTYDKLHNTYQLECMNPDVGTDFLTTESSAPTISTAVYAEGVLDYNRTFGDKHAVSGLLAGTLRQYIENLRSLDVQQSLPNRNLVLSGRFTYAYDQRYFMEFGFGYQGSERFSQAERYGFFPSIGAGWILSNESFWGERLKKTVNLLKLKATYGLVGNDAIGGAGDRFFYLSNVNLQNLDKQPISFGQDFTNRPSGVSIGRYANDQITWETSRKMNLGIELGLFNTIDVQVDYFTEKRSNILMPRSSIPSTMGLQADLRSNVGKASSHGFEVAINANHSFNKDFWMTGMANFTYTNNRFEVYDEPKYPYPWLSWVGLNMSQATGLIAERLFIDDADIANSPSQTAFGDPPMPGDIKYMDVTGDGAIDSQDNVPIGYPTVPKIMYGFGLSTGYKNFDVSFQFQGSAQSTFFIDPVATAPFLNISMSGIPGRKNNAMLKGWADSYWSEENPDVYALWPRLSYETIANNNQRSTWWMRNGSFLRLKQVDVGYTLPESLTSKLYMTKLRVYFSGVNLLTFSKFDMWDVEMGGNGLGYPLQRVYNLGIEIGF